MTGVGRGLPRSKSLFSILQLEKKKKKVFGNVIESILTIEDFTVR